MNDKASNHYVTWPELSASLDGLKAGLVSAISDLGDRNDRAMSELRREREHQTAGGTRQFFATMTLTVAMIAATATYFHQSSGDLRAHTDTEREHLERDLQAILEAMLLDDLREAEDLKTSGARGVEIARIPDLGNDVSSLQDDIVALTATVNDARFRSESLESEQQLRLTHIERDIDHILFP